MSQLQSMEQLEARILQLESNMQSACTELHNAITKVAVMEQQLTLLQNQVDNMAANLSLLMWGKRP